MCGIFGYLGPAHGSSTREVVDALLTGLKRLEYRGYDSAGVAFDAKDIVVIKEVGNIASLEHKVEKISNDLQIAAGPLSTSTSTASGKASTTCGIAHTRWATHGVPSTANSHPQVSEWEKLQFVVVHNGIITNYRALKEFLSKQGVAFESETDTEVIPKLCKYIYDRLPAEKCSFRELVSQVVGELEGAFALLFKSSLYPGELVGCKCGSPLLLGIKQAQDQQGQGQGNVTPRQMNRNDHDHNKVQFYFASDASAIIEHTKRVVVMEDNDVVHLKDGNYSTYSLDRQALTETNRVLQTLEIGVEQIMKGGYDHFMQKEIHEQPEALVETMRGRIMLQSQLDNGNPGMTSLDSPRTLTMASISSRSSLGDETQTPFIKLGGLEDHLESIIRSRRIIFIACGTSFHACLAARQLVEELTGIPVTLELASDLLDRQGPLFRDDTCIFVSQSGETADTLNALHYAKSKGSLCVGITNTVGSSISRETACGVHVNAGCEIGVASTKAYTCQIVVIIMIALKLSEDSVKRSERRRQIMNDLLDLPDLLKKILEEEQLIKDLAKELVNEQSLLVFGRGYNYATALEVALKVKEVSLMHSEGILAGELKHGPLALIDEYMPAVVVATRDSLREKMWSTIQQLLARKGRLILLVSKDDPDMANSFSSNKSLRIIKVDTVCDCLQPILNIVPFQLLSYHLTVLRGYNVDQPRNLAKSVTVE